MRFLFLLLLVPTILPAQINPVYIFKSNLGYNKLEASGDGLFGFEKDDKFGYMDKNENVVIPAVYSYETSSKTIPAFIGGFAVIKKDGKWGLLDKKGKLVIPFEYEYLRLISPPNTHVAAGRKDGNKNFYGILTTQNKIEIPLVYEDIQADSNLVTVKQNGKWGLMDVTGKSMIPFEFTALTVYAADKVLKAEKPGQYGFVDLTGKWLFEKAKSVYTLYSSQQGMVMCAVSSKYGFLDLKGNEVIITKYDKAENFESNGLAKVGKKSSTTSNSYTYGYIDKKGNEIIPLKYESMGVFSNGLVIAKDPETNRYGYMDKTGKWVLKPVYLDGLGFDSNGGSWVKMTDGKYHYINKSGKDFGALDEKSYKSFNKDGYAVYETSDYPYVLIDKTGKIITKIADCDGIYNFSESIAGYKCKSNSKYGFLDINGKSFIDCGYDAFTGFIEGVSRVGKTLSGKTKFGYISNKGETILPPEYDDLQYFRNGWGVLKKDGNYFFVDKKGNLKEPPRKYDNLAEFRSGYALGTVKGATDHPNTYYYINTQLKEEIHISAFEAYLFWDDVAVVVIDDGYDLMNKKGGVFASLEADLIKFSTENMLAIKDKGKWGFVDDKGNMVIPPKYDSCEQFKYGLAKFKKAGKWGILDKKGNEVFEAKYENIIPCENGLLIYYDKFWGVMDKTGKILVPPTYYTITTFEKDKALARLGKSYTILKSPLIK